MLFSPVSSLFTATAFAAPAVAAVPVTAEGIAELLVALGLVTATADGMYVWASNDNPYVDSIFEEQIKGITSGVPISGETLGQLDGTVIPKDVYTTDGNKFYTVNKPVTPDDIYVNADTLVNAKYKLPTNFGGVYSTDGIIPNPANPTVEFNILWEFLPSAVGSDIYLFPYVSSGSNNYMTNYGVNIVSSSGFPSAFNVFYTPTGTLTNYTTNHPFRKYLQIPCMNPSSKAYYWRTRSDLSGVTSETSGCVTLLALQDKEYEYYRVVGSGEFDPSS